MNARALRNQFVRFLVAISYALALSLGEAPQAAGAQPASVAAVSGTVVDADSKPVAQAKLLLKGPSTFEATSGSDGSYRFENVPLGSYRLTVSAAGFTTVSRSDITVAADVAVSIRFGAGDKADAIREIGRVSSTSGAAAINVTPAAVRTLNVDQYRDQNFSHLTQLLEQIPGVSIQHTYGSIGGIAGSLFYSPNPDVVTLSMRGALTYETAITYDGHPLASGLAGSGANVGPLGTLAMDRIELVRGPGAASSTINGAIGGTLNYVPVESHGRPSLYYSVGTDGFGGSQSTFRFGGDATPRLSFDLGYSTYNSPGPIKNASGFFWGLNGSQFNGATLTSPAMCPPQGCYQSYIPHGPAGINGSTVGDTLVLCCGASTSLQDEFDEVIKLNYRLAPRTTLSALYAGYQTSTDAGTGNGYAPTSLQFLPTAGYSGGLAPGSFIPSMVDYPTTEKIHQNTYEFNLKTSLGQPSLRLSYFQSLNSDIEEEGNPADSSSVLAYGTGWLNGSSTPTIFNGTPGTYTMSAGSGYYTAVRLYDWIAQIDEPVGTSLISLAYNHNVNRSTLTFYVPGPGPTTDIGDGLYRGFTQSVMLRSTFHPAEKLDLTAAMYFNRYDYHYSALAPTSPAFATNFTDAVTSYDAPRFGLTWTPSRRVSVRLGAGGAIAPIPLGTFESGYGGVPTPNSQGAPAYYTQTLAPIGLRAETAFGFSAGADFRLDPVKTIASVDVYRTNVFGQYLKTVTQSGTFNGLPLFTTAIGNAAYSIQEGVELTVARTVQKGIGYRIEGSLQRSYLPSVPPGFYANPATGAQYSRNLAVVPNTNLCSGYFNGGLGFNEECIPYSNGSAQVSYRFLDDGMLSFTGTYYGPNNSYYRPAFMRLDAGFRIPIVRHIALQLNAYNLNNIWSGSTPFSYYLSAPPYQTQAGTPLPLANGTLGQSPGGVMGPRTLSLSLTGKF